MSVIRTIIKSSEDDVKPKEKSYWGCKLDFKLVDVSKFTKRHKLLPSEKRALKYELSGIEPVEKIIVLKNSKKSSGRFSTYQIKEIFNDMGFNVDPILSEKHLADFEAVVNINGYLVPGWRVLAKLLHKVFKLSNKMLMTKLAPGKQRLHVRFFENNDGSWIIAAHTDKNWMNIFHIYKSHIRRGAGNYLLGTSLIYALFERFNYYLSKNKVFPHDEVEKATRRVMYQNAANRLKSSFRVSLA